MKKAVLLTEILDPELVDKLNYLAKAANLYRRFIPRATESLVKSNGKTFSIRYSSNTQDGRSSFYECIYSIRELQKQTADLKRKIMKEFKNRHNKLKKEDTEYAEIHLPEQKM